MDGYVSATDQLPSDVLQRIRELSSLRDRAVAARTPGALLDHIEKRSAYLQLALEAREQQLVEAMRSRGLMVAALCEAMQHDLETYRLLLREHTPTTTGHCQRCRLTGSAAFVQNAWPCPTVELIEQALMGQAGEI